MKQKLLGTALAFLLLAAPLAQSAEFVCHDDVKPASYNPEEQRLIDQFWEESLTYLGQYLRALETPTGECNARRQLPWPAKIVVVDRSG
jgi:hypothetical protein